MSEVASGTVTAKGVGTTVTFDGKTVSISRKMTSGHRRGERTIPVFQISGVDFRRANALLSGAFTLIIPGGVEARAGWSGGRNEGKNENTIRLHAKANEQFQKLRAAILDAI